MEKWLLSVTFATASIFGNSDLCTNQVCDQAIECEETLLCGVTDDCLVNDNLCTNQVCDQAIECEEIPLCGVTEDYLVNDDLCTNQVCDQAIECEEIPLCGVTEDCLVNDIELQLTNLFSEVDAAYNAIFSRINVYTLLKGAVYLITNCRESIIDLGPFFLEKYFELIDFAFKMGEKHPEWIESGMLVLPEETFTKKDIKDLFTFVVKVLYSNDQDYQKLRELMFELDAKEEILWDLEDSYDAEVIFQTEDLFNEMIVEKLTKLLEQSNDPLFCKNLKVFIEFQKFEDEDEFLDLISEMCVQYKSNPEHMIDVLFADGEPENEYEEKVLELFTQVKAKYLDFISNQDAKMNNLISILEN